MQQKSQILGNCSSRPCHRTAVESNRMLQLGLCLSAGLLAVILVMWGTVYAAPQAIRYVDGTSGEDLSDCTNSSVPCATIGFALGLAEPGDTTYVAAGIYSETLDLAKNVTLVGGFEAGGWTRDISANPTILDGTGIVDSVFQISPGVDATVEGFVVRNGTAPGEGGAFFINGATVVISATIVRDNAAASHGGGIWLEGVSNLVLVNSKFLDNSAGERGGGLAASGSDAGSVIELRGVEVLGNTAVSDGGGLSLDSVPTFITASLVLSNTSGASGGGIHGGELQVISCEIRGNEANGPGSVFGGGIAMSPVGDNFLLVRDSVVSDNQAVGTTESIGGGINAERSRATIERTIVRGNGALYNAGVSLYQTVLTMTNSSIVANAGRGLSGEATGSLVNVTVADNQEVGVSVPISGGLAITNSILWGNAGTDYECSTCTLAYSDVGVGDTTGTGNISQDPLFVDAAGGDYHLQAGSPCIHAGTPSGAPATDLEGTPRDAAPDMGAYEWQARIFLPLVLRY
jgi:hypothetical protein